MEQRIITARNNYIEFDQWVQENGCKKILMVCDGSIWYMDGFNRHLEEVEKTGVLMIGFRDFQPNPLYESVVKGVELFNDERCDSIIAVGIHSGPLAVYSNSKVLGLRTEEGDAYYEHWGVEQEPMGLINRRSSLATLDNWGTLVREAIQQPTDIRMELLDAFCAPRTVRVELTVIGSSPIDAKLQLWLTESNIVAMQMMPDGSANPDYVHNHVFRRSINGTWGEPYRSAQGEIRRLEFECEVDEAWNTNNLAVVAFIYGDKGVDYVTEAPVATIMTVETDVKW